MENPKEFLARRDLKHVPELSGDKADPEPGTYVTTGVRPAPSPAADVAELTSKIHQLQAENQNLYDRLLRKQAELQNYRKRTEREKEEFAQHANAELIRALLPSLDGFERALKSRDVSASNGFYKGMERIYQQLMNVLKREGLTRIEAVGNTFDPHLHQAVESVEDEQYRDQEIVEELLPGYRFRHRLLRPSMVKVSVKTKR